MGANGNGKKWLYAHCLCVRRSTMPWASIPTKKGADRKKKATFQADRKKKKPLFSDSPRRRLLAPCSPQPPPHAQHWRAQAAPQPGAAHAPSSPVVERAVLVDGKDRYCRGHARRWGRGRLAQPIQAARRRGRRVVGDRQPATLKGGMG